MSDCQHQSCGRTKDSVQTQRQQDPEKRERLLDVLTDCLADVEKESDIEELERRLTELDPDEELAENFDVEQSLDEFYRKYPVLGSEVPEEAESGPAPKKKHSRLYRNLARTAIIAAILCSSILAAQASDFNILRAIAEWTSEQFRLEWNIFDFPDSSQVDAKKYDSLQAVLQKYDVECSLVPTVFPEGTELDTISIREEDEFFLITAEYRIPAGSLYITIRKNSITGQELKPFSEIEKNETKVDVYSVDGIEHHILTDVSMNKAVWQNGEWECRIAGDVTREELIQMIDSIYA